MGGFWSKLFGGGGGSVNEAARAAAEEAATSAAEDAARGRAAAATTALAAITKAAYVAGLFGAAASAASSAYEALKTAAAAASGSVVALLERICGGDAAAAAKRMLEEVAQLFRSGASIAASAISGLEAAFAAAVPASVGGAVQLALSAAARAASIAVDAMALVESISGLQKILGFTIPAECKIAVAVIAVAAVQYLAFCSSPAAATVEKLMKALCVEEAAARKVKVSSHEEEETKTAAAASAPCVSSAPKIYVIPPYRRHRLQGETVHASPSVHMTSHPSERACNKRAGRIEEGVESACAVSGSKIRSSPSALSATERDGARGFLGAQDIGGRARDGHSICGAGAHGNQYAFGRASNMNVLRRKRCVEARSKGKLAAGW